MQNDNTNVGHYGNTIRVGSTFGNNILLNSTGRTLITKKYETAEVDLSGRTF